MLRPAPKSSLFPYTTLFRSLLMGMFRDDAPERSGTELLAGLSGLIVSTGHLLRFRHPILRRSEEHTSELQSPCNIVCRLLLEKKNDYIHTQEIKYKTPKSSK